MNFVWEFFTKIYRTTLNAVEVGSVTVLPHFGAEVILCPRFQHIRRIRVKFGIGHACVICFKVLNFVKTDIVKLVSHDKT